MSKEKFIDMNEELDDQINRIKMMNRTANETQETTNNISRGLEEQGEKINRGIQINKKIKQGLKDSNNKTNSMRRRNMCTKILLWILSFILFAVMVGLIIMKLAKSNDPKQPYA